VQIIVVRSKTAFDAPWADALLGLAEVLSLLAALLWAAA
jgi:hypothetical protein